LLTPNDAMRVIAESILRQTESLPDGALINAKQFLHLGSRRSVDGALKWLEERNELMRLARYHYVRPIKTRFGRRAPDAKQIVAGMAATRTEMIVPHGAVAAHALGLTIQGPTRLVYLTSAKTRRLKLGAQVVIFKHAPPWMLLPPQCAAGEAVRALAWIGKRGAPGALMTLGQTLPTSTIQELVALRPSLPGWLSDAISEMLF
jgi:hypothetical protein